MAISIRKNQNVQGIIVEKIGHKICQLADDTTIFTQNLESVSILVSILENFQKCSGLKLNMEKTEVIPIGTSRLKTTVLPKHF